MRRRPGISKYRARKDEAARKLENTRNNLTRIRDILQELKERMDPLEEQSGAAREYLRLREELRSIELNLFLRQYDRARERIAQIVESLEQLDAEMGDKQGRSSRFLSEIRQGKRGDRADGRGHCPDAEGPSGADPAGGAAGRRGKLVSQHIENLQKEAEAAAGRAWRTGKMRQGFSPS